MRGNAVLRAKRTTGPSAQTIMITHLRVSHCKHCSNAPVIVKTLGLDGKTVKLCADHINGKGKHDKAQA